ncbi:uncharacterized protein G2W53_022183 [Senna tora]|uniref:Uncharacterized protein n=1 Tax=Senna tora TaxID=362788 RepID=A0A834TU11_9FABA|nr:uncharacterized protein G2W53_022183 [Senna tora]
MPRPLSNKVATIFLKSAAASKRAMKQPRIRVFKTWGCDRYSEGRGNDTKSTKFVTMSLL